MNRSKTVLVLGGSYFIGKKIVDVLSQNGYHVSILNRGTKPNQNEKVNAIICDRDNPEQMKSMLQDYLFDFVVDVSGLTKQQVETSYNAINKQRLQKYVFISSSAVYQIDELRAPFQEDAPLGGNSYWGDYGTNKIEAEQFLIQAFQNSSTELTILRPPYVYGENNYAQRESFIFDHIMNDKPILIPNQGETKLQFIYTTDLANIIMTLLDTKQEKRNIFNVGNQNAVTVKEWIQACERVVQKEYPDKKAILVPFDYQFYGYQIRDFFPFFDYDNILDTTTIQRIYPLETNFLEGLFCAFDWYKKNKYDILFKENVSNNECNILKLVNLTEATINAKA